MARNVPNKGWKIVPVREDLWKKIERRSKLDGRSVSGQVEAILTGKAEPIEELKVPA